MKTSIARDFSYAAEAYDAHATLQQEVCESAAKVLQEQLKLRDTVLDVGCGTGDLAHYIKNPLFGCDMAEGMCVQTPYASCCADMAQLPFSDASFDAAFSSLAIQWVEEKPLALAEMCRVTKEDGVAVVTTLGPDTLKELRAIDIPTLTFLDAETYALFAQQAGWEVEAVTAEPLMRDYPSLLHLLQTIKAIGARHKTRRGYLRKSELKLPFVATWEVITLRLRKPA